MAISIDWNTKVITIHKTDMTLIQTAPFEVYELDLNNLRTTFKGLEESEDGIVYNDIHRHNTEVVLSGVTYARVLEIINGYTVTFENGQYAVNVIGANSNIGDVMNLNQVSLRSFNSAGMVVVTNWQYYGVENDDKLDIADKIWQHADADNMNNNIDRIRKIEEGRFKITNNQFIIYDNDGTVLKTFNLFDKDGEPTEHNIYERIPI